MAVLDRFRLDNRVAIVTGGTKGLGKAMAEGLAQAGAQVAVLSRHGDEAQAVAGQIHIDTGVGCRGYVCDVTDPDQVEQVVADVLGDFGQIDILINNAGINIPVRSTNCRSNSSSKFRPSTSRARGLCVGRWLPI